MQKALRVLAIIAIVAALIQVFDLVVEIIKPEYATDELSSYAQSAAQSARIRWLVYWPSGLVISIIAAFIRMKAALVGNSLLIGGVYLMLLGNNGGLWSSGHQRWRLGTSVITLAILIWMTMRLDKTPRTSSSLEEQS